MYEFEDWFAGLSEDERRLEGAPAGRRRRRPEPRRGWLGLAEAPDGSSVRKARRGKPDDDDPDRLGRALRAGNEERRRR